MKSTHQAARNQKVDRISEATLVVGVDIAKREHVARAVDYRGRVLDGPLTFGNDTAGFKQLRRWMDGLLRGNGMPDAIVGMESTGHYWFNLADWLMAEGVEVVLVNPATTKRNKENRDNTPSKSDAKDALVIADCVSRGYYVAFRPREEVFERLRELMAAREGWVTQATRVKNQIIRWLDIHFPEYASVFPEIDSDRSWATLKEFPIPKDLAGVTAAQVVKSWGKHMQRAGGIRGLARAQDLLQAARTSVGYAKAMEEARFNLACLLEEYERVRDILRQFSERAKALLREAPGHEALESLGLPTATAAAILAFAGDLRNYDHGNQLLRKAGLNLSEHQSGQHKGQVKLSKRGSARLRKHLFLAALYLAGRNPAFRRWHQENVEDKRRPRMQSMMRLIGKLARILVAMARDGTEFSPSTADGTEVAA